jgi:hypothetical protein
MGRCEVPPATAIARSQKARTKRAFVEPDWGRVGQDEPARRGQRACKLGDIGAGELGKLWRMMRQITWLNCPTIEPVL